MTGYPRPRGQPPDKRGDRAPRDSATNVEGSPKPTTDETHCATRRDGPADLQRRRTPAHRLPFLPCGHRKPCCRCAAPPPSDRMVDGYLAAAQHLHAHDLPPAPFLPELRALWVRGVEERRLVAEITERWELAGGDTA